MFTFILQRYFLRSYGQISREVWLVSLDTLDNTQPCFFPRLCMFYIDVDDTSTLLRDMTLWCAIFAGIIYSSTNSFLHLDANALTIYYHTWMIVTSNYGHLYLWTTFKNPSVSIHVYFDVPKKLAFSHIWNEQHTMDEVETICDHDLWTDGLKEIFIDMLYQKAIEGMLVGSEITNWDHVWLVRQFTGTVRSQLISPKLGASLYAYNRNNTYSLVWLVKLVWVVTPTRKL